MQHAFERVTAGGVDVTVPGDSVRAAATDEPVAWSITEVPAPHAPDQGTAAPLAASAPPPTARRHLARTGGGAA
ncbi:hypothetical protein [Yinghuangia sp. YIM S10712]|uniref:hypothetical protein n=1 Tax=Yinghuangia sp. YIM S10712 TaxID=3436930 RepID=UPI003F5336BF